MTTDLQDLAAKVQRIEMALEQLAGCVASDVDYKSVSDMLKAPPTHTPADAAFKEWLAAATIPGHTMDLISRERMHLAWKAASTRAHNEALDEAAAICDKESYDLTAKRIRNLKEPNR